MQKLIDAGGLDDIPSFLRQSALSAEERQAFGRIHPACMGGEYLPDLTQNEVAIARITIASVTQDVTCVYARRGKHRIICRVVDEYEGETLSEKQTRTSTRPLTLGELEAFLNGAWPIFDVLEMNFGDEGFRAVAQASRPAAGRAPNRSPVTFRQEPLVRCSGCVWLAIDVRIRESKRIG